MTKDLISGGFDLQRIPHLPELASRFILLPRWLVHHQGLANLVGQLRRVIGVETASD